MLLTFSPHFGHFRPLLTYRNFQKVIKITYFWFKIHERFKKRDFRLFMAGLGIPKCDLVERWIFVKIWQTVLSFLPFLGHFRPSLAHKNVKKRSEWLIFRGSKSAEIWKIAVFNGPWCICGSENVICGNLEKDPKVGKREVLFLNLESLNEIPKFLQS